MFIILTIFPPHVLNAEERVARLSYTPGEKEIYLSAKKYAPSVVSNTQSGPEKDFQTQESFDKYIFYVYTKQEIDAAQAQAAKKVAELEGLIQLLRNNVKDLSAANDSLVKRLDDLEKRPKQR
jgi:hypothetical protein